MLVPDMDPLAGTSWSAPGTVAGFASSAPNPVLMQFAEEELRRVGRGRVLDLGCGAARNAVPMAQAGWDVVAVDLSWPMLVAAAERARTNHVSHRVHLLLAPADRVPVADGSIDLVVAHGIWNLAGSAAEFRRAVAEAARVARPGAGLFVFTFSRNTFPPDLPPEPGEPFVFTQFSGQPQCFLTAEQLVGELAAAGFVRDQSVPWQEYNRRDHRTPDGGPPVIHEAAFRRR
ncbi:MAG TPA: methyltransferase domain-containing protein [Vicinamibacterales bacterium]|nr:methyltransferase domain-containing protein [Vicinamibacterales bacterium]